MSDEQKKQMGGMSIPGMPQLAQDLDDADPHMVDRTQWSTLFHRIDSDGDGVITGAEFKETLVSLGFPTENVSRILDNSIFSESSQITYDEFLNKLVEPMDTSSREEVKSSTDSYVEQKKKEDMENLLKMAIHLKEGDGLNKLVDLVTNAISSAIREGSPPHPKGDCPLAGNGRPPICGCRFKITSKVGHSTINELLIAIRKGRKHPMRAN